MTKKDSDDLTGRLLAFLSSPQYRPLAERDLAKALRLGLGGRGPLRRALRTLAAEGKVRAAGGGKWVLGDPSPRGNELRGTLRVKHSGDKLFAPFDPALPWAPFASPPPPEVLHGDAIEVTRGGRPGMFEGVADTGRPVKFARLLKRNRKNAVGILRLAGAYAYLVPRDPRLGTNIPLDDPLPAMRPLAGHLVGAELLPPVSGEPPRARFAVDFGSTATAANEIPALLFDHARAIAFSEAVLAESRDPAFSEEADRARRDLRGRLVFTLDPADAHDFDDAISLDDAGEGRVRLGVHIADVAAYVLPGSAVDREARERGCTAYLVDRVERMLPEELTVKTCSLQPGEDHRAHTVDMVLDEATGRVLSVETFRSVIRSSARLDYESVQAFLDGERGDSAFPPGIAPVLRRLAKLAAVLRKARFAAGALDFALPEIHCLLGQDGEPEGFEKRGASEAYNLVEECMLLANKAVAEKLFAAKVPFLSRIHDEPDAEQWEAMGAQLAAMGLPVVRNPREINRLMRQLRGDPREYMAQLAVLRNLNRAVYSEGSRPHFGLAFKRYAHFTSPIRRYPDLVVHRMLCALEEGRKPPVARASLAAVAAECSEAERAAAELEQESVRLKRIRYYANALRAGETGPWEGIVTGFSPKGIFVELCDTLQTGLLPFSALADGFYEVAADGLSASAGKKHSYRLGQRIRVALGEVDERNGRIDWTVPEAPRKSGKPPRKGGQRERKKEPVESTPGPAKRKRKRS